MIISGESPLYYYVNVLFLLKFNSLACESVARAIGRCFGSKPEDEDQSKDGQESNGVNRQRKCGKTRSQRREDRAYDALQYEGG